MIEATSIGRAQTDFEDASRAVELAGNDCAQLCKALSSMSRAAERLCELTKDGGDDGQRRCNDARAKLEAARARVREKCPACEPG
jgi:tRNA A-37 threonylcarbamoyl transferase component Bud32